MSKEQKLLESEFPIIEVNLTENDAIITRKGKVEVHPGRNIFVIDHLSGVLDPNSVKIVILDDDEIKLQNPSIELEETDTDETTDEMKRLETELEAKLDTEKKLSLKQGNLVSKRDNTKNVLKKTGIQFLNNFSENVVTLSNFTKIISHLDTELDNDLDKLLEVTHEHEQTKKERNELEEKIAKLRDQTKTNYHRLSFNLEASEKKSDIVINIHYKAPSTWNPSYDFNIKSEMSKINVWSIIKNKTQEDWDDINLNILYSSHSQITIDQPTERNLSSRTEILLDDYYKKYQYPAHRGHTTNMLRTMEDRVTVPADDETHAYLMHTFETETEVFYYWNAAETDYVIQGISFVHQDIDLLSGRCNFFESGEIIGIGVLPDLIKDKAVKLPISVETELIATKRLIKQESNELNKVTLSYQLSIVNRSDTSFQIQIVDVLPLSKNPNSYIQLNTSSIPSSIRREGLMIWDATVNDLWTCDYQIEIGPKETK